MSLAEKKNPRPLDVVRDKWLRQFQIVTVCLLNVICNDTWRLILFGI